MTSFCASLVKIQFLLAMPTQTVGQCFPVRLSAVRTLLIERGTNRIYHPYESHPARSVLLSFTTASRKIKTTLGTASLPCWAHMLPIGTSRLAMATLLTNEKLIELKER
jgi:hypothetical protein